MVQARDDSMLFAWLICSRTETQRILDRIREAPILPQDLTYFPAVHVIDLAEDGYIKPHVDSIKVRCLMPLPVLANVLHCTNSIGIYVRSSLAASLRA